ncbi:hypothetical protein AQPE_4190 [Aquipluma nitroreducens]|uniref:Uncharacterized protein n=1 Tax=Aquipluma nitroreducens TaxID=2010828 RepID=A0A5K7SEU3_9BACT|nr:hypothetical protein AQPE_4190 [Aquipluma nitroreducens]
MAKTHIDSSVYFLCYSYIEPQPSSSANFFGLKAYYILTQWQRLGFI